MINSEYIPVALPILLDYLLVVSCDFNPVYYLLQHHFTVQGTVDICTPYPEYVLTVSSDHFFAAKNGKKEPIVRRKR